MEHFEEITETKTVTTKKYIKTTCDICEQPFKSRQGYSFDEVTIEHSYGTNYPGDCGSGTTLRPDICSTCFEKKYYRILEVLVLKLTIKNHGDNMVELFLSPIEKLSELPAKLREIADEVDSGNISGQGWFLFSSQKLPPGCYLACNE